MPGTTQSGKGNPSEGVSRLDHQRFGMNQKPTILISGASRGLGAETALAAAQLGADVILTARSEEGLAGTAQRIAALEKGTSVETVSGDLASAEFCSTLAERVSAMGPLHAVVLNAAQIEPIGMV